MDNPPANTKVGYGAKFPSPRRIVTELITPWTFEKDLKTGKVKDITGEMKRKVGGPWLIDFKLKDGFKGLKKAITESFKK